MKEVESILSRTFEFSEKEFLKKLNIKGKVFSLNQIKIENEDNKIRVRVFENISVEEVVDGEEDKDRDSKD